MGVPLAIGSMVGGSLLSAYGQLEQGEAAAKAAEYNAALQIQRGRQQESLIRRRGDKAKGQIRASVAKSGVTMEGSPLEVLAETAANIEMDALNARYDAFAGAEMTRAEGRNAKRASRINAAAGLLSGGARAASTGRTLGAF